MLKPINKITRNMKFLSLKCSFFLSIFLLPFIWLLFTTPRNFTMESTNLNLGITNEVLFVYIILCILRNTNNPNNKLALPLLYTYILYCLRESKSVVSKSQKSLKPDVSGCEGAFAVWWAVREVLDWWCQRSEANSLCALLLWVGGALKRATNTLTHRQREKDRSPERWKGWDEKFIS